MIYALVNKETGRINHSPTATNPSRAWSNAQLWEEIKSGGPTPKIWRKAMKNSGWVARPVSVEPVE